MSVKAKAKAKTGKAVKKPEAPNALKTLVSKSPKFQAVMDHLKKAWSKGDAPAKKAPRTTAKTKAPKKRKA